MKKRIKDFKDFVNAYNQAIENGEKRFKYIIKTGNKKIVRIFKTQDFKIKLTKNKKLLKSLLKTQNRFIIEKGSAFCPCKIDYSDKNICPCKNSIQEIFERTHCHCSLYFKVGNKSEDFILNKTFKLNSGKYQIYNS